jgi:hypothetical protein
MNSTCGSTPPNPTPDLPNRSTDLRKTLEIVGTPHGESIARRDEQHPWVNSPKSNFRSPESLHGFVQDFGDSRNTSWGVHSQVYVHKNLPNQEESKKSLQELL